MGKKLEEVAGRPNRCAHQLAHLRTNAVARAASISFWQAASHPGGASRHASLNDFRDWKSEIKCVHSRPVENAVANVKQVARLNRIEPALRVLRTATLF
jgi:hypothetical protein